jgi:valyl-tRNA synthetase
LAILEARKKTLEDLKNNGLILDQRSITHTVNVHDKCGTGIEFLPTEQWFIKILDKKKELIAQGRKIKWHPEHMFKRYENWVNGLEWDWSSSRNRHFGVPIPVWHCKNCGEVILPEEKELPVDPLQTHKKCPKCRREAEGEKQVLDTWLTSSLTPQIVSDLVKEKVKVPYSLRPQAHDIIRTWAFYTIVKSYYHEKKIPWTDIAISGFVTLQGEKMSKSKGNVVSPREVMDKFGADAIRYWASSYKLGDDVDYQENDLVAGKKFVTKLLNAARFVFMNLKHQEKKPKLLETDRLFLTQVNKLVKSASEAFEDYNYARSKLETERFFWQIFADNYLEIVKDRVYNGTEEEKASAFWTLYQSLLTIVKLMAPITPYITEEVYQNHFREFEKERSVHLSSWPEEFKIEKGKNDEKVWNDFLAMIARVRQAKSEAKKAMNSKVVLTLTQREQDELKDVMRDFKSVMNVVELKSGEFKVEFVDN